MMTGLIFEHRRLKLSLEIKRLGSFRTGKRWWGLEYSMVKHDDSPYLERWLAYVGGFTLRLHKFHRGDDDRAPHDHPWWFVTFPLRSYEEVVVRGDVQMIEKVKAFRFHYRPATYRHIVKMPPGAKPFFTFVVSGQRSRGWGFWPGSETFIPWKEWI